jgi:NAD(P)-dependent dehydrogenase (short-subunit alcohol dehydrogenase family)
VIALSRREAGLRSPRLESIAVDLGDPQQTRQVARDLAARTVITTLVHNAGAVRENLLADTSIEDLTALTNLHLAAPITLLQACLPAMQAAHYGRVVLIASRAMLGLARRSAYSATKAGMVGLARTWALELGPQGITVNVVAPGPIEETEMFESVMGDDIERRARLAASIPVRRLGNPVDVARAVSFFVEPAADFITGQTLLVCGGSSVGILTL